MALSASQVVSNQFMIPKTIIQIFIICQFPDNIFSQLFFFAWKFFVVFFETAGSKDLIHLRIQIVKKVINTFEAFTFSCFEFMQRLLCFIIGYFQLKW